MVLLILAAFAQGAAAAPASAEALMVCAAATLEAESGEAATVPANYYLMSAVRADPQGKGFYARLGELAGEAHRYRSRFGEGGDLHGRAAAVRAECDARHPLARATGPVDLPAAAADRDILCYDMIGFFRRLGVEPAPAGLDPARTGPAEEAYGSRLGGDTAALMRRSGELLLASLDIGNIESIARACTARLDG
jgi:hypothetical protein